MNKYNYCCRITPKGQVKFEMAKGTLTSPKILVSPWEIIDAIKLSRGISLDGDTKVSVMEFYSTSK